MATMAMEATAARTARSMMTMNQAARLRFLGRGLGDSHGVDEGVRDEEEELHVIGLRRAIVARNGVAESCWARDCIYS